MPKTASLPAPIRDSWLPHLALGVTGHRATNPAYSAHAAAIRTITARAFDALASDNVALAGRVMIEHTDLVVAVWDGKVANLPGGTGHTVAEALKLGAPVLLIDPAQPDIWRILGRPEELGVPADPAAAPDFARLEAIIRAAVVVDGWSPAQLGEEQWRPTSGHAFGLYRRIERLFGGEGGALGSPRCWPISR